MESVSLRRRLFGVDPSEGLLRITGLAFVAQQSHSLHDLSGLTIAALGHVEVHPRLLHGMQSVLGEPFYRGNLHAGNAAHAVSMRMPA